MCGRMSASQRAMLSGLIASPIDMSSPNPNAAHSIIRPLAYDLNYHALIRLGYFEHPSYVPLLHSAYRLWRELENETGQQLLHVTGIAEIGQPDSEIVKGTLRASQEQGLPHRVLDARQAMQCFPAFRLPSDYVAVVQPDGGYLFAERAVFAFGKLAKDAGANLRTGETAIDIVPHSDGVTIKTDKGSIDAGAVVVTPGAWSVH